MEYYNVYLQNQMKLFNEIVSKTQAMIDYCIKNQINCKSCIIKFKIDTPLDDLLITVFKQALKFVIENTDFENYHLADNYTVSNEDSHCGNFANLTIQLVQNKER